MAEEERFELSKRFRRLPAFQASALSQARRLLHKDKKKYIAAFAIRRDAVNE